MRPLIKRLKMAEGFSAEPYRRPAGYWTVGHGHRCNKSHPAITIHEAHDILLQDIYKASGLFMKLPVSGTMNTIRRGVCVELIFWCGFNGFMLFKNMREALDKMDYKRAALELFHSDLGTKYPTRAQGLSILMWEG